MCPNYLVQLVRPVFLKMLVLWQGEGSDEAVFSLSLFFSSLSRAFLTREVGGVADSRAVPCSWLTCKQHAEKRFVNQSAARSDGGMEKLTRRVVWVLLRGSARARWRSSSLYSAVKIEGCEGHCAQMSLFAIVLGTWCFGNRLCYLSHQQQGGTLSVRDKPRCILLKDF